MNYTGKFDAHFPTDGLGSLGAHSHAVADVHVAKASHAPADAIIVPDAQLLFHGDLHRSGVDLILSKDDHELVLQNYFKGEKRVALASPDGAHLTGDIISALTGHQQFAQADGSASVSHIIGHVTKLIGTASAIRNGVSIILNNGDNVEKGDVVESGANSTLGITFIDGTVFGLASNAKMVLNEMVYDPNRSDNSSLISLVAGTISFVAGETAKHGDMKVDTPVATMGIRGTAVLVEIDFSVPGQGGAPSAQFQVLVEPDGTTGSYILFDKTTLAPLWTVNQAGQAISVNNGNVSVGNAALSADIQKLITDVFAQKFTDNTNTNTKTAEHFTDTLLPQAFQTFKLPDGTTATAIIINVNTASNSSQSNSNGPTNSIQHIPGKPIIVASGGATVELTGKTGDSTHDTATGNVNFVDVNKGDAPTVSTSFDSFTYHSNDGAALNAQQLADIKAVEVDLLLKPDPGNNNNGVTTWTYSVPDHAFDFLAAGETLTLTYTARVDNNYAPNNEFNLQTFTITITGTNDVPTIAATSAVITEHSSIPDHAGGTITFTDADLTDRPVVTTAFGSFTYQDSHGNDVPLTPLLQADIAAIEAALKLTPAAGNANNGAVTWSYDVDDSKLAFLSDGDTLTLTYLATVDDGHGGVTSTPITVTLIGVSDVPFRIDELSGKTGDTTDLDTATGTLTFTGVDLNNTQSVTSNVFSTTWSGGSVLPSGLVSTLEASLTPSVTNSVGFKFSAADHTFDFLADGETLTVIYDVTVVDHNGISSTRPVTIIITGTNDAPTIVAGSTTASGGVTEDVNVDVHGNVGTSGTIVFQDVDLTDTHTATFALKSTTSSAHLPGFTDNTTSLGTFALAAVSEDNTDTTNTASLGWTFTLNDSNPVLQSLAVGQTITEIYTVTVSDGHGGTVPQDVTVTITGTNDAPTIVAETTTASGGVTEDTNVDIHGNIATSGTIAFQDIDLIDTHTATFALKSSTSSAHLPGFTDNSSLGTFALAAANENNTDTTNTASLGWTFTLDDSNPVLQSLAVGQTITEIYTVTVSDGHGGTVPQDVTVTITGTNDAPTIVAGSTTASGGVTEDTNVDIHGNIATSGTIAFQDVDLIDTHTATFALKSTTSSAHLPGFTDNTTSLGTFALAAVSEDNTDTTNTASLGWTFTLDDSNPVLQSLAVGQTITEIYTVTVSDGHGGTVPQDVKVTITGTNDAPTIVAASTTASGGVTEDVNVDVHGNVGTSGTIVFQDVDLTDTHTATFALKSSTSSAHLPGFTDNSSLGTFALAAVSEDNTDTTNTASLGWTFTLNDSNPVLQSLAVGQTITEIYTVTVSDGHGGTVPQDVTVTITGTNDAPTIVAGSTTASGGVTEDTNVDIHGNIATSGTIAFQDVDLIDTHTATFALKSTTSSAHLPGFTDNTSSLGAFALAAVSEDNTDTTNTASLGWTFTLDDSNPVLQSLAVGQTITEIYTVTVSDGHGGTVPQDVKVTITGTNDAPTIVAASTTASGGVTEDTNVDVHGNIATSGTIAFQDVDLIDTHTATFALKSTTSSIDLPGFTDNASSLGTFALAAVNENNTDTTNTASLGWTFTLNDSNPILQSLGMGQTITEIYTVTVSDGHGGTVPQDVTVTITGTNDAPVIVSETDPSTQTVILARSPVVLAHGVNTNSLGLETETFDSRFVGLRNFTDSDLGATFTASGNAGIVHGSSSVFTAPFVGPSPGHADTTNYLGIGAGGTETITFADEQNAFGLYWGSVDAFNTISFYDGTTLVASYTGADISPLLATGGQGTFASNGYVEFSDLAPFNKVVLASSSNAFEVDNVSAGFISDSHIQLASPITGTLTINDVDVGDTLTASVLGNAVVKYDGSTTLPSDVNVAALIDPNAVTFDSVTTTGGLDVLHWTYNPVNADLDFLEPGDTLTVTFQAKVSDGHTTTADQALTVTIVGTGASVVNGTAQNDTFVNVGGNVTIFGHGGQDTFVFKPGFASATIGDFDVNNDTIDIDHSLFATVQALLASATPANSGHDTIITDAAHDTITLKNVTVAQLNAHQGDFHIT